MYVVWVDSFHKYLCAQAVLDPLLSNLRDFRESFNIYAPTVRACVCVSEWPIRPPSVSMLTKPAEQPAYMKWKCWQWNSFFVCASVPAVSLSLLCGSRGSQYMFTSRRRRMEGEMWGKYTVASGKRDRCMLVLWKQREVSYCCLSCWFGPLINTVNSCSRSGAVTHNLQRQLRYFKTPKLTVSKFVLAHSVRLWKPLLCGMKIKCLRRMNMCVLVCKLTHPQDSHSWRCLHMGFSTGSPRTGGLK